MNRSRVALKACFGRALRSLILLGLVLVALTAQVQAASAGFSSLEASTGGVRGCGPFTISRFHDEYGPHRLRAWDVKRSSLLRCSMARRLIKAAYGAGPLKVIRKVYETGGSGRPTYWLKNGWRCGNGAGGAACFNEYKSEFNSIELGEGTSLAVTASTG